MFLDSRSGVSCSASHLKHPHSEGWSTRRGGGLMKWSVQSGLHLWVVYAPWRRKSLGMQNLKSEAVIHGWKAVGGCVDGNG